MHRSSHLAVAQAPDDEVSQGGRPRCWRPDLLPRPASIGAVMTLSTIEPQYTPNRGPRTAMAIGIGIAGVAVALTLALVGLTFLGLAIAFPIAVPIATAYLVPIKAADAALAASFAP